TSSSQNREVSCAVASVVGLPLYASLAGWCPMRNWASSVAFARAAGTLSIACLSVLAVVERAPALAGSPVALFPACDASPRHPGFALELERVAPAIEIMAVGTQRPQHVPGLIERWHSSRGCRLRGARSRAHLCGLGLALCVLCVFLSFAIRWRPG